MANRRDSDCPGLAGGRDPSQIDDIGGIWTTRGRARRQGDPSLGRIIRTRRTHVHTHVMKGSHDLRMGSEQTGDQDRQQGDHNDNRDIESDHTNLLG
jgi:hypothetical protein